MSLTTMILTTAMLGQCNLFGQSILDNYYVYEASEAFDCFNTVPVDAATVAETTKAALEMIEFYHGTDIALSTDPNIVGRVDLKATLQQYASQQWLSDFQFHSSVAQLFLKLHDGHTSYQIPRGYLGGYLLPFAMGSKLENGQQVLYVRALHQIFPSVSAGQPWSGVKVNDVISTINGEPAVSFMAKLLDDNSASKSAGSDFNEWLADPASAGIASTLLGFQQTHFVIVFSNQPGVNFNIPLYLATSGAVMTTGGIVGQNAPSSRSVATQAALPPNSMSEIASNREAYRPIPPIVNSVPRQGVPLTKTSFPDRPLPSSKKLSDIIKGLHPNQSRNSSKGPVTNTTGTTSKRTVQELAPSSLWKQGKIIAQYPANVEEPNIVCSSFETNNVKPVMYLHVGTFSPDTSATTEPCEEFAIMLDYLKVVERCNEYAIAFSPRITELVVDVRGNGGGFLLLASNLLEYLSPKLAYPPDLRSASKTMSSFHVSPPSAASGKGSLEFHFNEFTQHYVNMYYAVLISSETFNSIDTENGANLYDEPIASTNREQALMPLAKFIEDKATLKSRAAGSPNVFVVPKVNMLFESFFDGGGLTQLESCGFPASRRLAKPTKGFATMKVLSLGSCASACAQTIRLLKKSGAASIVTAGGIQGTQHRVSASSNGPFYEWNTWASTINANNIHITLTELTRTNAKLTFSLAAFYSDLSASISDEYSPMYADHVLSYWPPFSESTELNILEQTAALASPTGTGWVEYEGGTFTPVGAVSRFAATAVPPTVGPAGTTPVAQPVSTSDDSDIKLRNALLIIILPTVFVCVGLATLILCCRDSNKQKDIHAEEEMN
eukprot:TRINITY_DN2040_c0_g1_i1.p1 TRINITY_DN2040_c0_g1~~TRINITY_DN2040_c0_g1_i1.p1  ORF type:complete len:837 (+),score=118.60 TRINITY_DN2040_c0_g1_i1:77-2587(+)